MALDDTEQRILWRGIHASTDRAFTHLRDQKALLEQMYRLADAAPGQWWTGGFLHGLELAIAYRDYAANELTEIVTDDPEYIPF